MSNRKKQTSAAPPEVVPASAEQDEAEALAPPLQKVELIRKRIMHGQMFELVRLRSYISMAGENQYAVDALHGVSGDEILSLVADTILRALGAEIETAPDERFSKTKRAAAKRMRG